MDDEALEEIEARITTALASSWDRINVEIQALETLVKSTELQSYGEWKAMIKAGDDLFASTVLQETVRRVARAQHVMGTTYSNAELPDKVIGDIRAEMEHLVRSEMLDLARGEAGHGLH